MKKTLSIYTLLCFLVTSIMGLNPVFAQDFRLPAPGVMINLSPAFNPAVLKGIRLDPKNPFRFHFFVDSGDSKLSQNELKNESSKLIKYFLASLTIPEKDLWVNLSPYEKDRIVPQEFGQTEMGRDLLAEDYILKQITASLIYPDSHLGKEFWQKVYAKAQAKYGTTNIPINTFNKVWIVPEKAVIYENGGVAFVLENHLKVMLEQDYLSLGKHEGIHSKQAYVNDTNQLGSQVVREIVIPALTKEVNEGKNFFQLRQVFYSLILATWYKRKIKDSILNRIYSNQNKIAGLNVSAKDKDKIYQEYLKAFKKGVYNYIKEEPSPMGNEVIPRKYFSGGVLAQEPPLGIRRGIDSAMIPGLEKSHFVYEDVELRMDEAMNVKKNDIAIPEQQLQTFEQALENQARSLGYSVNKDTKFILQLGDTLDKSRYYITFNAALKMGGDNILLLPVKTMPADLERIMRMGRLSTKVIGFNITSPHKINAIQYLDELDEFAISGAVEAVVKQKDGTLKGYNLDGEAWVYWYTQILKKSLQEKKIVVLGAGGAARSIIYSIFSDAPLSHIVVYDRQKGVADTLKNDLGKRNPRDIKVATMSNLNGYIKESDIVINLTGSGKSYDDRNPSIPDIDYNLLNGKLVFDANYRFVYEGAQNEFLKHAKEAGATIFNGLGLSVATIPLNIMLFTGKKSEYQDLIKIAKAPLIEGGAGFQDEAMTTNEIIKQIPEGIFDYKRFIPMLRSGVVPDKKRFILTDEDKSFAFNVTWQRDKSDADTYILDVASDAGNTMYWIHYYTKENSDELVFADPGVDFETDKMLIRGVYKAFSALALKDVPIVMPSSVMNMETRAIAKSFKSSPQPDISFLSHSQWAITLLGRARSDDFLLILLKDSVKIDDKNNMVAWVNLNFNLFGTYAEQLKDMFRQSKEIELGYYGKPQDINLSLDRQEALRQKYPTKQVIQSLEEKFIHLQEEIRGKGLKFEDVLVKALDFQAKRLDVIAQLAPDLAMTDSTKNTGGIDFNPAQMSMQVKKDGQDFKFDFNGTEIDATQVTGATFTIRTMTPVTNLPKALGLNMELLADNKIPQTSPML